MPFAIQRRFECFPGNLLALFTSFLVTDRASDPFKTRMDLSLRQLAQRSAILRSESDLLVAPFLQKQRMPDGLAEGQSVERMPARLALTATPASVIRLLKRAHSGTAA